MQLARRDQRTPLQDLDGLQSDYDPHQPGFQVTRLGVRPHRVPVWAADLAMMLAVVRNHPQARRLWVRWVRIAWLYYREGQPAAEIAELLGCTAKSVRRVIEQLNARGQRMLAESGAVPDKREQEQR